MLDTIRRILAPVPIGSTQRVMDRLFEQLADRLNSVTLSTGTLAIKAGGSALAKTTATVQAFCGGQSVTLAASDMAALAGTISTGKFNVYCFYVSASGSLSTIMGTEGASLAAVRFPEKVLGTAWIGFVILNPTAAPFIGGTTALDAANTNAVYVNVVGPADPTFLMS